MAKRSLLVHTVSYIQRFYPGSRGLLSQGWFWMIGSILFEGPPVVKSLFFKASTKADATH